MTFTAANALAAMGSVLLVAHACAQPKLQTSSAEGKPRASVLPLDSTKSVAVHGSEEPGYDTVVDGPTDGGTFRKDGGQFSYPVGTPRAVTREGTGDDAGQYRSPDEFPEEARPALRWLEHLSKRARSWSYGSWKASENWPEASAVPGGVSASGLVIRDVNRESPRWCPASALVPPTHGKLNDCLWRIGHLVWIFRSALWRQNKAYSVEVGEFDNNLRISIVPGEYNLKFRGTGTDAKLVEVEYLTYEDH